MGMLGGWLAALLTFGWLSSVPAFGAPQFIVLGLYVALYAACWCVGVVFMRRRGLPLLVFAPMLWVALDLLRHHAGFLALPIASLGQSQHAYPAVLQIAALGGEYAVTWLVVLGNGVIALCIERRALHPAWAAAAAIAAAWGAGAMMLLGANANAASAPTVTLAAVQPVIGRHERETAAGREQVWQRLRQLTLDAARAKPDLIVWPEGAVGDPRHDAELAGRLAALAAQTRASLLVGSSETEKFTVDGNDGTIVRERETYNAAYLVREGAPLDEPYRKRRLMPFGEYTPHADVVAWPRWLVPPITQGRAGDRDADLQLAAAMPLRLGVVICWENLFADLSRSAVRGGAQVLVQLTNDARFPPGRAATQHNAASVLRAVENGVPLVLASNAGPSLVIDAYGRVVSSTGSQFDSDVTIAQVAVGRGVTPYARWGEWFAAGCAVVLCSGLLPRRMAYRREHRPSAAAAKECL